MKIDFSYSKHYDLVFHVLVYLKVNNASNLYDKNYIISMKQYKKDFAYDIIPTISSIEKYYNENFQRLGRINFLPYYNKDFDDMREQFRTYQWFTEEDKQHFVEPFIDILEKESEFYFKYWDTMHGHFESTRIDVQNYFIERLSKFAFVFEYYQLPLKIVFSYSITRNGRGIICDTFFTSVVKYPFSMEYIDYSLFFALHEYTHSFTDRLLQKNINMKDGSHVQSEVLCILADYYLFKAVDETLLSNYIMMFCPENPCEDAFLSKFEVSEELYGVLQEELGKIFKEHK